MSCHARGAPRAGLEGSPPGHGGSLAVALVVPGIEAPRGWQRLASGRRACAAAAPAAEVPTPEMLRVLEPQPEGPRITPFLAYQLERAWAFDAARQERFARVRTEADLRGPAGRAAAEGPRRDRRAARREDAAQRARHRARSRWTATGSRSSSSRACPASTSPPSSTCPTARRAGSRRCSLACGHSPVGKAHPGYQEIAVRLARRGYVVLCWDPVGQGERSQFWDEARGRSRYNLVCGEHAVLGNFATIAGTSLVRYMVWDGMRAVDYLLTRDDVDASRLAITGTSGGGFQSLWIGALDPRIAVVLPSCFPTALPMRMANRIFEDPDSDPEQDPPGLVSEGIDHPGLLLLAYPRPLHVSAAVLDFFPIEGTRKTMREVAAFYRRFGHGDRIALSEGYHKHQYSAENQAKAFAFLDRAFGRPVARGPRRGEDAPARGPAVHAERPGARGPGRALADGGDPRRRAGAAARAPTIGELYRGPGYPGIRDWPVVPFAGAAPARRDRVGGGRQRARREPRSSTATACTTAAGSCIPLVHVRREGGAARRRPPAPGPRGEDPPRGLARGRGAARRGPRGRVVRPARARRDAHAVQGGLDRRPRRWRRPTRTPPTRARSPASSRTTSTTRSSSGRPYLFEMIEDVEIAVALRPRAARRAGGGDRRARRRAPPGAGRSPRPCPTWRS